MDNFLSSIVTVATAIVGVAIVAVLVSKNAQTPALIQNATVGFASDLEAAVSPLSTNGFTGLSGLNYANGS